MEEATSTILSSLKDHVRNQILPIVFKTHDGKPAHGIWSGALKKAGCPYPTRETAQL
jgi:hypothetical protein